MSFINLQRSCRVHKQETRHVILTGEKLIHAIFDYHICIKMIVRWNVYQERKFPSISVSSVMKDKIYNTQHKCYTAFLHILNKLVLFQINKNLFIDMTIHNINNNIWKTGLVEIRCKQSSCILHIMPTLIYGWI